MMPLPFRYASIPRSTAMAAERVRNVGYIEPIAKLSPDIVIEA
jgi:hypothetical protein